MTENSNEDGSTTATLPQEWVEFVTPFANVLGKSVEEATNILKQVVGEPGSQAIELLKDTAMASDSDIKSVLSDTPSAIANMAISKLRAVTPSGSVSAMALGVGALDILPTAPADEAWLSALKVGGILKVDQSTVVSAIRAALAQRLGLFEIPESLSKAMEQFADNNDEPVPEDFFKLRRLLTRRNYAEIFETIEGLDGTFVTDARKNQLFKRVDDYLWPTILSFQQQLKGWIEGWQQGAANPAMLAGALMALSGGGTSMPPTMMAPPETGALRDAADAFNDQMNKVFSGTGIQIASALALDANRIKQILENQHLPAMIGVANRDQMLRQLGVEVSATYPRLEVNLIRYVLSVMKIKDLTAGNDELQYFSSLFMLGSQIPWEELNKGKRPERLTRS